METVSKEKATEEQYIEINNKKKKKNQLLDYKTSLEKVGNILYSQAEQFPDVVKGFNMINGLTEDASIEETHAAYQKLVQSYAQMVDFVSAFQEILEVRNENGEILNTVVPKNLIMKKLEDSKEIVSERDAQPFPGEEGSEPEEFQNGESAKIWIKIRDIENEHNLKADMLRVRSTEANLKQVISNSQFHFGYVYLPED